MFMLREMAQYIALVHFYTGGITKFKGMYSFIWTFRRDSV